MTAFSVSWSSAYVGSVDTGTLVYTYTIPNDPETAWVNIQRIQCDNPASHGGAYVPKSGAVYSDVFDKEVLTSQLGTTVS